MFITKNVFQKSFFLLWRLHVQCVLAGVLLPTAEEPCHHRGASWDQAAGLLCCPNERRLQSCPLSGRATWAGVHSAGQSLFKSPFITSTYGAAVANPFWCVCVFFFFSRAAKVLTSISYLSDIWLSSNYSSISEYFISDQRRSEKCLYRVIHSHPAPHTRLHIGEDIQCFPQWHMSYTNTQNICSQVISAVRNFCGVGINWMPLEMIASLTLQQIFHLFRKIFSNTPNVTLEKDKKQA